MTTPAQSDHTLLVVADGGFVSWDSKSATLGSTTDPLLSARVGREGIDLVVRCSEPLTIEELLGQYRLEQQAAVRVAVARLLDLGILESTDSSESIANRRKAPTAFDISQTMGRFDDIRRTNPEFFEIYELARPFTLTSLPMCFALYQAAMHVISSGIQGGFVESGVGEGGSTLVAALTFARNGEAHRPLYLFDTFDWTWPTPVDADGLVDEPSSVHNASSVAGSAWRIASPRHSNFPSRKKAQLVVDRICELSGYRSDLINPVVGDVRHATEAEVGPLSMMRLDTDLYESTKFELDYFYPHLVAGGVVIIDDYAKFAGPTRATHEWLTGGAAGNILLSRIESQGRMGVKPLDRVEDPDRNVR